MTLVRWEPARELQSLQQEMNRLFGSFFEGAPGNGGGAGGRQWIPAMDLVETDEHYVLRADLPGLGEDDVNIEFEENVLTISGERHAEQEQRGDGYYRFERATGRFARSLTLPSGVDPEHIEANFANGVLEVRIPKPEQARPRRVAIGLGDQRKTIEGTATEPQAAAAETPADAAATPEQEQAPATS